MTSHCQLLEAARRQGGEPEAEKVWSMMLDNQLLGLTRGASTTENLAYRYNDEKLDAAAYVAAMGLARTNEVDVIGAVAGCGHWRYPHLRHRSWVVQAMID